mmetsp:Transcript_21646/g.30348  ORF Transcript_21646/g.30348 Transcript_21646/m.30348 type:complete len:211 (+) Transcript_21646:522-1154(+)
MDFFLLKQWRRLFHWQGVVKAMMLKIMLMKTTMSIASFQLNQRECHPMLRTVPVRESVSESVILPLDYYVRHERNNSIRPESPSRSRESQPILHELSMSRRSRMTVRDLQHLALRTSASPDMENKTMPRSTLNESEQKVCKVGQDSTRKKSSEKRLINRIEIGHRNELDIRVTPMQKSLQLEDLRKLFTKLAQTRMHWEKNDHVLECHVI